MKRTTIKEKSIKDVAIKTARIPLDIISGNFFKNVNTKKIIPLTVYIIILLSILIGNTNSGQKSAAKIESLTKEIKLLKFKHISIKTKLTEITKQTSISKQLKSRGIFISKTPPQKITIKK